MLTSKEWSSRPWMTGVLKPYYLDLVMLWKRGRLRNSRNVWKQMTDAELRVPVGVKSPGQMTWLWWFTRRRDFCVREGARSAGGAAPVNTCRLNHSQELHQPSALQAVTMQDINNCTVGTKIDTIHVFSIGFISYSGWLQKPSLRVNM